MAQYWLVILAIVVGCQMPRYGFREVGTYSDDPSSYQKLKDHGKIDAKITFQKVKKKKESDTWILEFEMALENVGTRTATLFPEDYVLLDDEGHRMLAKNFKFLSDLQTFKLWPKSSLKVSLSFELPPGVELSKTGSLRILWSYRIKSRLHRRVTKFIKQRVEYRYWNTNPNWYYYHHYQWYNHPNWYSSPCYGYPYDGYGGYWGSGHGLYW